MPAKRKNIQKGNGKNSQGKKTKVESNPEERFQQDNGSNTNERISCKCNKLWVQKRLLTHIKRDSNCRSKYTEEEIEAIDKVSKETAAQKRKLWNKNARAKIQNDEEKQKIQKQKDSKRKKIARAKIKNDEE